MGHLSGPNLDRAWNCFIVLAMNDLITCSLSSRDQSNSRKLLHRLSHERLDNVLTCSLTSLSSRDYVLSEHMSTLSSRSWLRRWSNFTLCLNLDPKDAPSIYVSHARFCFDPVWKARKICCPIVLFRCGTTCCLVYQRASLRYQQGSTACFTEKQRDLSILMPLWQSVCMLCFPKAAWQD